MKKILIAILVLALLGGIGYAVFNYSKNPSATQNLGAPALTQAYSNNAYNFALMMPADFAANESQDPDTGGATVVLQNNAGDGIQIVVSPFDEDTGAGYTLTKERILQDVPDLAISDEQPVNIGPSDASGRFLYTGIAFKSDNQAFGGDSREVWFAFRGNLYQISTYARLDPLLKAIFATWQFN